MILSHQQIEEIAAAVTKDFNEFFFGKEADEVRIARATPIDQLAKDYLGLNVSFARLSYDGSICGLTAYADTEYIIEEMGSSRTFHSKEIKSFWMRLSSSPVRYTSSAVSVDLPLPMSALIRFCSRWNPMR